MLNRMLREAAGAEIGDLLTLELTPGGKEPEPKLPADLRKVPAGAPGASRSLWSGSACDMHAAGKGRVFCFDRSGVCSNSLSAPQAAKSSDGEAGGRTR